MDDATSEQRRRRSSPLLAGIAMGDSRKSGRMTQQRQSLDVHEGEENKPWSEAAGAEDYSISPLSSDMEMDDMHSEEDVQDDEETGLTIHARRKRKRRKRRNTRLDERVAAEHNITKEEEKLATQSLLRESLINALFIALW